MMDEDQIRDYCEEALEITDRHGVYEGLSYLIGEKFSLVLSEIKKTQSQVKFIYQENQKEERSSISEGWKDKSLKLNYSLTVHDNYRLQLKKLKSLEKTRACFVIEIKESFDPNDIQDYLNSYPRLRINETSPFTEHSSKGKVSQMSTEDIFSEVQDILFVEEMKKLLI
ncbi:MAG: hypothetical protein ACE5EK_01470 [Nitrospinales bacterium]